MYTRKRNNFYASVLFVLFNLCILVGILIIIHIMFFFIEKQITSWLFAIYIISLHIYIYLTIINLKACV